jgi:hypothetical protein
MVRDGWSSTENSPDFAMSSALHRELYSPLINLFRILVRQFLIETFAVGLPKRNATSRSRGAMAALGIVID